MSRSTNRGAPPSLDWHCDNCGQDFHIPKGAFGTHRRFCTEDPVPRFWAKVEKRGPDECWPWQGAVTSKHGYGNLIWHGKYVSAHRVAWTVTNGPVPAGMCVLHKCDNRICCNPAHYFLGTKKDNNDDKMRKGRHHSVGQDNVHAKLTNEQAKAIYARYRFTSRTESNAAELAAEFNTDIPAIHAIGKGRRWGRVTGAHESHATEDSAR